MDRSNLDHYRELLNAARRLMLDAESTLEYAQIIAGHWRDGKTYYAVAPNTFRSFHKTEDAKRRGIRGIDIYKDYFTQNRDIIVDRLKAVDGQSMLNKLENEIYAELKIAMDGVIKPEVFWSYNRLRKIVDLSIEHLVCMSIELADVRKTLIKWLYLPLDSYILDSDLIFTRNELISMGIKQPFSQGKIKSEKQYNAVQNIAERKSEEISDLLGEPFYRIYFDMLWNDRIHFRHDLFS